MPDNNRFFYGYIIVTMSFAFTDESQTNIEYLVYAHQDIEEGLIEVAQLFQEAARAEMVHALSHLKAMGVVRSTRENLEEAVEGEDLKILSMYPKFIEEAENEGSKTLPTASKLHLKRKNTNGPCSSSL